MYTRSVSMISRTTLARICCLASGVLGRALPVSSSLLFGQAAAGALTQLFLVDRAAAATGGEQSVGAAPGLGPLISNFRTTVEAAGAQPSTQTQQRHQLTPWTLLHHPA